MQGWGQVIMEVWPNGALSHIISGFYLLVIIVIAGFCSFQHCTIIAFLGLCFISLETSLPLIGATLGSGVQACNGVPTIQYHFTPLWDIIEWQRVLERWLGSWVWCLVGNFHFILGPGHCSTTLHLLSPYMRIKCCNEMPASPRGHGLCFGNEVLTSSSSNPRVFTLLGSPRPVSPLRVCWWCDLTPPCSKFLASWIQPCGVPLSMLSRVHIALARKQLIKPLDLNSNQANPWREEGPRLCWWMVDGIVVSTSSVVAASPKPHIWGSYCWKCTKTRKTWEGILHRKGLLDRVCLIGHCFSLILSLFGVCTTGRKCQEVYSWVERCFQQLLSVALFNHHEISWFGRTSCSSVGAFVAIQSQVFIVVVGGVCNYTKYGRHYCQDSEWD